MAWKCGVNTFLKDQAVLWSGKSLMKSEKIVSQKRFISMWWEGIL